MKLPYLFFGIAILFFGNINAQYQKLIKVNNHSAKALQNELVIISRSLAAAKLGALKQGYIKLINVGSKEVIPLQFDDLNGDGEWDEAVFVHSFVAQECLQLKVLFSKHPEKLTTITRLANSRHRPKLAGDSFGASLTFDTMPLLNTPTDFSKKKLPNYLTEGPAWENDKVAFRLYFDTRNCKDIFGKRIPQMIMDTVGVDYRNNYHLLAPWGMDVLHVGKSLGAGGLALKMKVQNKDTLVRLGGALIYKTTYKQIANGPYRSMIQMNYWCNLLGEKFTVSEYISIWGGQYFYESQVKINGLSASEASLVIGIANFNDNKAQTLSADKAIALYSFGNQSENKDALGMAIMVPQNQFIKIGSAPSAQSDILDSHLLFQKLNPVGNKYRFYAGWGLTNSAFASESGFRAMLQNECYKWNSPLVIR